MRSRGCDENTNIKYKYKINRALYLYHRNDMSEKQIIFFNDFELPNYKRSQRISFISYNEATGRDDGESLRIMKDGRRRSMIANIFARAHNQYFPSRIFAVKYEGINRGEEERKGGGIYT